MRQATRTVLVSVAVIPVPLFLIRALSHPDGCTLRVGIFHRRPRRFDRDHGGTTADLTPGDGRVGRGSLARFRETTNSRQQAFAHPDHHGVMHAEVLALTVVN